MNRYLPTSVIMTALITTQILGPGGLWAADQRGVRVEANRRVVVAAISGDQPVVKSGGEIKALHFRDVLNASDEISTGDRTFVEVLVGNRAVVTLGQSTTAQFTALSDEQATVQLKKGIIRVAASASALGAQGTITIQTPSGQVQTRGGIIRVILDAPIGAAEHTPIGEARPYLATYAPNTRVAAARTRGEIIQVEEGTADIPGAGPGGRALTMTSGQSVTMQSGQAGSISRLVSQGSLRAGVLAHTGHSSTPKEGVDNLVALQVAQATALGKALTGTAEKAASENEQESGKRDATKNAIIGTTGGVTTPSSQSSNNSLVNSLYGGGNTTNTASTNPQDRTGTGFGSFTNNGILIVGESSQPFAINGSGNAQLIFTHHKNFTDPSTGLPVDLLNSMFKMEKELMLVGGTPNDGHFGTPPIGTLILRGANTNVGFDGIAPDAGFFASDLASSNALNSVLLVDPGDEATLDQFAAGSFGRVDGAITATGANVVLRGGVTLDRSTQATIGTTNATNNYFSNLNSTDAKYSGSLLAVINGPNNGRTSLTMLDRMLGVYDGSKIDTDVGNKALLSVLDAWLTGPQSSGPKSVPLIDIDAAFMEDGQPGVTPNVMVTSAIVTRSTAPLIPLDRALLIASAPLLALTNATMTTSSHFADLAGNKNQALAFNGRLVRGDNGSLMPVDSLVALNAATLTIENGHFLNLNNAIASIKGYLFSLTGGSTLDLQNGTLFNLTNASSLTLNGNAFGVFGIGDNTLSIKNDLCSSGPCGQLMNSANQPIFVDGVTPLHVAGVNHNVVLPGSFNVFALAQGASTPHIIIGATDALFKVEDTSTLTINSTAVVP